MTETTPLQLSKSDYLRVRSGLLFVCWGLVYFSFITTLGLSFVGIDEALIEAAIHVTGTVLIVIGLTRLFGVPVGSPYRLRLVLSVICLLIAGTADILPFAFEIPAALTIFLDTFMALSALFFVLALRVMAERANWVGVKKSLFVDQILIGMFWVGLDVILAVALLLPILSWKILLIIPLMFLMSFVAVVHLWLTVAEVLRTARLRQGIASRRKTASRKRLASR